jgi:hypothetical protein
MPCLPSEVELQLFNPRRDRHVYSHVNLSTQKRDEPENFGEIDLKADPAGYHLDSKFMASEGRCDNVEGSS